jgi:hypothetical protein
MLDIAFTLKRSSVHQVLAYLLMPRTSKPEDKGGSPFFEQFDEHFQQTRTYLEGIVTPPSPNEVAPPFLQKAIGTLIALKSAHRQLFENDADSVYDFPAMKGFAAVWSVLEFIFCLKEVQSQEVPQGRAEADVQSGAFVRFGEGVFLASAALLCICRQHSLAKVLSIGARIVQQKNTDLVASENVRLKRFLECHALIEASFEFAVSSVLPAVLASSGR